MVGTVVTTLADEGLRVRSEPRVSDDSEKYDPLLPPGTQLYVLDGPVSASGYAWYEVVPLTSRTLPSGWVASASRDGDPWIAAGVFDCPPVPTDFRSLEALPARRRAGLLPSGAHHGPGPLALVLTATSMEPGTRRGGSR